MILKARAKEESLDLNKKVFYISLAAVGYKNRPFNQVRSIPAVFDVATEKQFSSTSVTFISAPMMHDMYLNEHQYSETNVYTLLQWFIKKEPDSSYFIDEYGWNMKFGKLFYFIL